MIEREYVVNLYLIYKEFLNEKERNYFEYYYFEDYSLGEIADLYEVSRSYASKYLNQITSKLTKFEEIQKINHRNNKIKDLLTSVKDDEVRSKIEELL